MRARDNELMNSGRGALTPPDDSESDEAVEDAAPVDDVEVMDAGASAQGIVVAECMTVALPSTVVVQVVEMTALDSRAAMSSEKSQRPEPSSADFLRSTTGWPSLTQASIQPLPPTSTDLHDTTSISSSPEE